MRFNPLLAVLLVASWAPSSIAQNEVLVATFNTGLHHGILRTEFVPCVDARRRAQLIEIEKLVMNWNRDRPFILMLQEVWDNDHFKEFERLARRLNATLIKDKRAKKQGLVILTNGQVVDEHFELFDRGGWFGFDGPRGIFQAGIRFNNRIVTALNTQTDYSESKDPSPEHVHQLRAIVNYLRSTRNGIHVPAVFAGDLGTGPDHHFIPDHPGERASEYPPADELWGIVGRRLLAPMNSPAMIDWHYASGTGVTWDATHNPYIRRPAGLIVPALKVAARDDGDTTMDHIFYSSGWEESESGTASSRLIFNRPVKFSGCFDWETDIRGTALLSPHYGVQTILHFPSPKPPVVPAVVQVQTPVRAVTIVKRRTMPAPKKPAPKPTKSRDVIGPGDG